MGKRGNNVLISGSLVYDKIFDYAGRFRDVILPSKVHMLNVSFTVSDVHESFGGTAGNIAYSARMLGVAPVPIGCLGADGIAYLHWLTRNGISRQFVKVSSRIPTASFNVITDMDDNQIGAFQIGALSRERAPAFSAVKRAAHGSAIAVLAPGNVDVMYTLSKYYARLGIPYLFDPGQMIPQISPVRFRSMFMHAAMFISNDYERHLTLRKLGISDIRFKSSLPVVVTTLGSKGSIVYSKKTTRHIAPAVPASIIDPTGAGDAYRAGFIAGIVSGLHPFDAAQVGSVCSVYTVERQGTQTHAFTRSQFARRYRNTFHKDINLKTYAA